MVYHNSTNLPITTAAVVTYPKSLNSFESNKLTAVTSVSPGISPSPLNSSVHNLAKQEIKQEI